MLHNVRLAEAVPLPQAISAELADEAAAGFQDVFMPLEHLHISCQR